MAQAGQNFTDNQKAAIYARDRATCCFSGAKKAYENACDKQDQLTHDTFECIQADYRIRYGSV